MKREISNLEKVKTVLMIVVTITWVVLAVMLVKQTLEIKNEQKKEEEVILEERNYLSGEYTELKKEISDNIVTIATKLEGNTTLVFSEDDKADIVNAYKDILAVVKNNDIVDKVTVADDLNLDIYTAIIIMNEDLKGFASNFALAIDNRDFDALDISLKYLSKIADTMNNMDNEIKNIH